MIHVFLGTDHEKARAALAAAAARESGRRVRLTDTSSAGDLAAVLAGGGMFGERQVVVLDRTSDNKELWSSFIDALPRLAHAEDTIFVCEEKLDAATKRLFEKFAEKMDTFDLPKKANHRSTVFSLVNHLRAGDKKRLWVAYHEELMGGNAAEAIHGVLFWGAKQMLLQARGEKDAERARLLVIALVELPHESRRRGEELEYALERFVLSIA